MIKFHERMLPTRRGSNPRPPNHQSDAHPTKPPRPARSNHFKQWMCPNSEMEESMSENRGGGGGGGRRGGGLGRLIHGLSFLVIFIVFS